MKYSFSVGAAAFVFAALPLVALALATMPFAARAASPATPSQKEAAQVVGLFEGMESGDLEVKLIPKDSTEGTVTIRNKTGKPLSIKLPEAFAGVPVLAQFDVGGANFGAGNLGVGGGNGGGQNQAIGGGMNVGMGQGPQMGGIFNVGPEKVAKLKIVAVCLEHGKRDPNPRVPYKLIPIESFAKSAEVGEVVKMLVQGELDQLSAQAAVWHLQNGLTWEELAGKIGAKHLDGRTKRFFTSLQIEKAKAAVETGTERAAKAAASPGEALATQE